MRRVDLATSAPLILQGFTLFVAMPFAGLYPAARLPFDPLARSLARLVALDLTHIRQGGGDRPVSADETRSSR